MGWLMMRLFVRFLGDTSWCLWCDVRDRFAGRCLDWRLRDVVGLCWEDFTMRVLLCWRATQYDRRMRRFRRMKGVK
jgi:hypothetical protein